MSDYGRNNLRANEGYLYFSKLYVISCPSMSVHVHVLVTSDGSRNQTNETVLTIKETALLTSKT
jgi:hypothetical protein